MHLISVFFVSLSMLAFEVLLTRIFSISQWNHLSFMVISIALFGFGASGTLLSIADIRKKSWRQRFQAPSGLIILLYLYASSTVVSFLAVNHMALDYFRLPVEPVQLVRLLAAYLLLAMPFFFAGTIISLAYIAMPQKTGLVYFASMVGSAVGAVLPIFLLPLLDEGRLIIFSALIALIPVLRSARIRWPAKPIVSAENKMRFGFNAACGLIFVLIAGYLLGPMGSAITRVAASPYKALSQILQIPATRIIDTHTGITGRIDRVATPYIRYAPGLSLKFSGPMPGQDAVFRDGDNQLVLYDMQNEGAGARFATYLLSYGGYHMQAETDRVLLILAGGGSSIACAAASAAGHITILERSAQIAAILRQRYPYHTINQHPRTFLARNDRTYDIVQIENWGASILGADTLSQVHLFTIEAWLEYWNHLSPRGAVIASRKLLLPPSDSLRLWCTAYEALLLAGIERPASHLAMLRNFDTFSLIVSKPPIQQQRITEFAESLNFDLVFLQGMTPAQANRFHVFDQPYHYNEIKRLAEMYRSGRQHDFFRRYILDVAPQTDSRPFPARFLKWTQINERYRSMGSRLYALFMSGEIVIAVVFIEALLVALLLLVMPIFAGTRAAPKPHCSLILYFFGIGAGFMFVEIYFIKRFIILVGDPVISFTLVVAGILFSSGLAGMWVYRNARLNLRLPAALLIAVIILEVVILEVMLPDLLKAAAGVKISMLILFLLPAGFLMGLPFPIGMRDLLDTPLQRAYGWSVNGCASVLSAIAAAQLAISWGIAHVAAAGILAYAAALLAVTTRGKE